jgi:hypothetical protein
MIPQMIARTGGVKNERYKNQFDLPEYDPPRFNDGAYTHETVSALESEFACEILSSALMCGITTTGMSVSTA